MQLHRLQLIAFIITFLLLCSHAKTLKEIYNQMHHIEKETVLTLSKSHPDYHRTKDREIIGSFRGQPIYNRQHSGFVDANGVPVPVLPYARRG
ncbi:hypothetical protein QR680_015027 [Steinernema hermaphroditum]|uniref:Uncharacterized protein n=1 Tax=Steinernema hermaphroditum TaxID=289476 RepID=A0AA39ICA5_9BILA|nr:hypothetical protein QR680_015027 [Steinernema hermaphroditum]